MKLHYDLGSGDSLVPDNTAEGFAITNDGSRPRSERGVWWCTKHQIPALVDALRDLGHITDPDPEPGPEPEPEPLSWYTVKRHGQPGAGLNIVADLRLGVPTPEITSDNSEWGPGIRWLPLSALRGHTELPGWNDVAPPLEPELPEPWIRLGDPVPESADGWWIAYAWAYHVPSRTVAVHSTPPHGSADETVRVMAWCPLREGQLVPPHPDTARSQSQSVTVRIPRAEQ